MSLALYEVVRWGNDSDDVFTGGPNGPDTCFLVRARDVQQAAAIVDAALKRMRPQHVVDWAGAMYLLGTDAGTGSECRILRGPYVQHAYRYGWRQWNRDEEGGEWIERTT